MKTKFFKRLSFVLVVAMVLSLFVPAAGAFAAKAPKLNSTNKYLHLDVDKLNEYNFNVANKQKGWKYFWESANEDVAVVNEKNGVTTATGVGKTKVTLYITNADGEKVQNLSATVTVRDNIKEVTVKNPVDTLAVGEEHDYNRSFETVSGSNKKTSAITRWVVEPSENASIDDKGVFVATEAGEYTVTALSFQSKARYNNWLKDDVKYADYVLDTDTTKVVVGASMVAANQVNADTVKVSFDSVMEDVKDLNVYQIVGTTKVKQLIKEAKLADDKLSADVTVYIPFTQEATYVVEYPEMEDVTFVAARKKAEDVASIKIDTSTAIVNETTDIDVKILNSNGVDITTPELSSRVSLEAEDVAGTFVDTNVKNIIIFEKGLSVKITATFHSLVYDETGEEVGNFTSVGMILGVDKDATNLTGLKAWTIVANDATPNFDDVKQTLSVDDTLRRLFVQFNTKTGSETNTVNSDANAGDFLFESSDENVLIVDTDGTLYPLKAGSAVVVVKYGAEGATKTPVGAVSIVISPEAKATNLVLTPNNFSLSDATALDDKRDVSVKVTDQLGREIEITDIDFKKLNGPTGSGELTSDLDISVADKKITFGGKDATPGSYSYQVIVTDKNDNEIKRTVSITVQKSDNAAPTRFALEISDNKIDVKAANDKLDKNVTIKLFGFANNIKVKDQEFDGVNFKLEIDAPKNEWDATQDNLVAGKYNVLNATSGNAITKAPTGNYKVTAYQYKDTNNDDIADTWVPIDYKYFVVEDTQAKPALTEVKTLLFETEVTNVVNDDANVIAAANECFVIKLDGNQLTVVGVEADGTTSSIGIKTLTVREWFDNDGNGQAYYDHKVTIGRTIKAK